MDRYVKEIWRIFPYLFDSHSGINFTNIVFHLVEEIERERESKKKNGKKRLRDLLLRFVEPIKPLVPKSLCYSEKWDQSVFLEDTSRHRSN